MSNGAGQSLPPSFPLGTAGTWLPPPQVGFGGNAPFPTPVVPPGSGLPGVVQPQYTGGGSATVPPISAFFPAPSTTSPKPPIVFANIMMIGAGAPPSTPTTPVIPTMTGDEPSALPDPDPEPEPEPEPAPDPEPAPHHRAPKRTRR
jgi:hypothetical protein